MAGRENLLTFEVIKIIYEEGAKFLFPDKDEGFAKVSQVIELALGNMDVDTSSATTRDFRKLYHKHWADVLEELVPYEAHDRVTQRFRRLVF